MPAVDPELDSRSARKPFIDHHFEDLPDQQENDLDDPQHPKCECHYVASLVELLFFYLRKPVF